MRNPNFKIYLSGTILGTLVLIAIFFLFGGIGSNSQQLLSQKEELILLAQKLENLEGLQAKSKIYQENLEKIKEGFVDPAMPIEFIQFLEKSALDSGGELKISSTKETKEPEPILSLNVSFSGSFSNLFKFIDKLENGPYLIELSNLNVKGQKGVGNIVANLELITLAK